MEWWSRRPDSNRRPSAYKAAALPLSYAGLARIVYLNPSDYLSVLGV